VVDSGTTVPRVRQKRSPRRRPFAAPRRSRATPAPLITAAEAREAFRSCPVASALLLDGVVASANEAFARALGTDRDRVVGRRLARLLPPERGALPSPLPGAVASYRTVIDGVAARVDLAASAAPRKAGGLVTTAVVTPVLEAPDTAADRALLALSRELAEARSEDAITSALARALELLFPSRSFCIRLVDPKTLALTTLYARGRLRPQAKGRLALRAAAIERTGLPRDVLEEGGVVVTERDEPLFEGCDEATAVPLTVAGQLFGVVNLEYEQGAPGLLAADAPLLYQLANHAALGVRNVRSIEELTYLKTYLEDLIEHANALIGVVNRSREVIVWNAALVRLTGLAKEEVLGDDVSSRIPHEDRVRIEEALLRGFAGESSEGSEMRLLKRGGGEVRIAVNTAPIFGASGEVEGVIAIGHDLTLVRSLQAAAEHAERLAGIGRLVAGVVHELNNPLTAVNMYSDVLVEKLAGAGHDPTDVEKLRAIKDAGSRIQRLARDLVTYAKPSGGRTEPVDLAGVVDEGLRLAKPALKESSAVVAKRLAAVAAVEGNRPSLVHVVVNLVTNAAQAVREGGAVTIALEPVDGHVRLVVSDDGPGMPPDVAARAFEPFFTTRPGVGIGLGLPIVQGIVARHGGRVDIETAPGEGTKVFVTFPVRREPGVVVS
jgi:PAS domain S-box-containing protein